MSILTKNTFSDLFYRLGNGHRSIFVFFLTIIFLLGASLYVSLGKSATKAIVAQFQKREEGVAVAGAAALESFLKIAEKSLVTLSIQISDLDKKDQEGFLDNFIQTWENTPLVEVAVLDNEGRVESFAHGLQNGMTKEESFKDTDFYLHSIDSKKDEAFIGKPFLSDLDQHKDSYLLPISVPIIKDGQASGVLVGMVQLSELTAFYLDPLKVTEKTRVYLIDKDGTVLYSQFTYMIGQNYFQILREKNFIGSEMAINTLINRSESSVPGTLDIALPNEETKQLEEFLVAYSPISHNTTDWILAVGVPKEEVLAFVAPYYVNQLGLMLSAFMVILFASIVIAKSKAYKEGFIDYGKEYQRIQEQYQKKDSPIK